MVLAYHSTLYALLKVPIAVHLDHGDNEQAIIAALDMVLS